MARKNNTEVVTIRDRALAFTDAQVDTMRTSLAASFDRRDIFETSQGLDVTASNSYTKARDAMLKSDVAVSRLFLALAIEPSHVIERKVVENAMFNAKALDKVREIAVFASGIGERMQRVTRAFIACALIATDKGVKVITNDVNRAFLNSADLSSYISDRDLLDNLDELRHRAMSSGDATQSSQARNVLDVLGLGSIKSVTKARDAIELDTSNDFYALFRGRFMK